MGGVPQLIKPKLLVGARLVFTDGTSDILAYPTNRAAYGNLCRLLSKGKRHAPKGECYLTLHDLVEWQEGLLLVVMPPHPDEPEASAEPIKKFWNENLIPLPSVTGRNNDLGRRAARRPPPC